MPGPGTQAEALVWIQDAMRAGRYILSKHCEERMVERAITAPDIHTAISRAVDITPYDGPVQHGGTSWRVSGDSLDEEAICIGVEAYLDKRRRKVVVCTVFVDSKEQKS